MVYQMRLMAPFIQLLLQDWQHKVRSKNVRMGTQRNTAFGLD